MPGIQYYRELRTRAILKRWKGLPGEFYMLKGLLCISAVFDAEHFEGEMVRALFDSKMIAERMDEIQNEALAPTS